MIKSVMITVIGQTSISSFARNKIVYKNEIEKNEDWLYETGRTIGSRLIYKFWDDY